METYLEAEFQKKQSEALGRMRYAEAARRLIPEMTAAQIRAESQLGEGWLLLLVLLHLEEDNMFIGGY